MASKSKSYSTERRSKPTTISTHIYTRRRTDGTWLAWSDIGLSAEGSTEAEATHKLVALIVITRSPK